MKNIRSQRGKKREMENKCGTSGEQMQREINAKWEEEPADNLRRKKRTEREVERTEKGECKGSFNLEKAVCNHGFFMMPPNLWSPSKKTLERPLRLSNVSSSVYASISHPSNSTFLVIQLHHIHNISSSDKHAILEQVGRMLRISKKDEEVVREFQKVHEAAKNKGFGRVFRSPSLFEDVVKSLLLCNCTWGRTLKMAKSLCELQYEIVRGISVEKRKKRKRTTNRSINDTMNQEYFSKGNFPNAEELAGLSPDLLEERCKLGYRANYVINLAQLVKSGRLDLTNIQDLVKIKGFGSFVCANVSMCIGFYQNIPADTETMRHLKQVHGLETCSRSTLVKDVKAIYDKYSPFQALAYWFELLNYYESKCGKLSELPCSKYPSVTGSVFE